MNDIFNLGRDPDRGLSSGPTMLDERKQTTRRDVEREGTQASKKAQTGPDQITALKRPSHGAQAHHRHPSIQLAST
jgi:hypothetical protein